VVGAMINGDEVEDGQNILLPLNPKGIEDKFRTMIDLEDDTIKSKITELLGETEPLKGSNAENKKELKELLFCALASLSNCLKVKVDDFGEKPNHILKTALDAQNLKIPTTIEESHKKMLDEFSTIFKDEGARFLAELVNNAHKKEPAAKTNTPDLNQEVIPETIVRDPNVEVGIRNINSLE
jgi:hypothetical protein